MVHRRGRQQRRDRNAVRADRAVRQDQDVVAVEHRVVGLGADASTRRAMPARALVGRPGDVDRADRKASSRDRADLADLLQVVVGQDRLATSSRLAAGASRPSRFGRGPIIETRHITSSSRIGVDRRVGDLGEVLLEVVVEQLGLVDSTAIGVSVPIEPTGRRRRAPSAPGRTACLSCV